MIGFAQMVISFIWLFGALYGIFGAVLGHRVALESDNPRDKAIILMLIGLTALGQAIWIALFVILYNLPAGT